MYTNKIINNFGICWKKIVILINKKIYHKYICINIKYAYTNLAKINKIIINNIIILVKLIGYKIH